MSVAGSVRSTTSTGTTTRASTLTLTWVLAAILVAATSYGLLADAYRATPTRELLGPILRGQDLLTLLSVPVLIVATVMAQRGSLRWHLVSLGILLYVPYSYLMYVVVPYNDAFLLYVAAIGLGSYLLLDGLLRIEVDALRGSFADVPRRGIGWFLTATGALFATMWLVQNLAVLPGGVPDGLFVYDIPSTVHVLDLAFVLPAVIATGVMLLRGHPAGPLLAAVMLVKMVTLGLALLFMNGATAVAGSTANAGETAIWTTIVVVSAVFLLSLFGHMTAAPAWWLRRSLWDAPSSNRAARQVPDLP